MFGDKCYLRGFSLQDKPAFSFCGQSVWHHTLLTTDKCRKRFLRFPV